MKYAIIFTMVVIAALLWQQDEVSHAGSTQLQYDDVPYQGLTVNEKLYDTPTQLSYNNYRPTQQVPEGCVVNPDGSYSCQIPNKQSGSCSGSSSSSYRAGPIRRLGSRIFSRLGSRLRGGC